MPGCFQPNFPSSIRLAWWVALPLWGVRVMFFNSNKGWSLGRDSGYVTSNAAALMSRVWRASTRASWSTSRPLLMLMRMTVGFINLSSRLLIRPWVWAFRLTASITKSDRWSRSPSLSQFVAPTASFSNFQYSSVNKPLWGLPWWLRW